MIPTSIKGAGKATIGTTNFRVSAATGFTHFSVYNTGEEELRIKVDGDSTVNNNIIYVAPGEVFSDSIIGYYITMSVASGTTTIKYVVR